MVTTSPPTPPPPPAPPGPPTPPGRPDEVRGVDVAVGVVLLLVGGFLTLVFVLGAVFYPGLNQTCSDVVGGASRCRTGFRWGGPLLMGLVPVLTYGLALAWSVARMRARRVSWWIPAVQIVLALASFGGGVLLLLLAAER